MSRILPGRKYPASALEQYRGIYFLFNSGELIYIGQASNVHARILEHKRNGKKVFDEFSWIQFLEGDLDLIESEFIIKYKPPLNVNLPHNVKYRQIASTKKAVKQRLGFYNLKVLYSGVGRHQVGGKFYFDVDLICDAHQAREVAT